MSAEAIVERTSASSTIYVVDPDNKAYPSEKHFTLFDIDPSQAWFWTAEWQAKEREVDQNLAAGRYRDFDDVEELIRYLNSDVK